MQKGKKEKKKLGIQKGRKEERKKIGMQKGRKEKKKYK